MRPSIYISAFAAILCLLCSGGCSGIELPHGEQKLVIEGWIDEGGYPVVIVTTTVPVGREPKKLTELKENIVRWATVSVSDGEKEVFLTGGRNDAYFPPYIYTSSEIRGQAGKTYALKVLYNGKSVTASTTIPESVPLEYIRVRKSADAEDSYYMSAGIKDDPDTEDYYKFFTRVIRRDSSFVSSFMGLNNDETLDKEITEVPIHNGTGTLAAKLTPYFSSQDRVVVKFCRMDRISYRYWNDFDEVAALSRNPIFPVTTIISTNISGGLGYWAGYGAVKYPVSIADSVALGKVY